MADRFLVLANSRKQGGRCVAVVNESGTWLRPVSGTGTGELSALDCVHAGTGESLLPLDAVEAEFGDAAPTHYQPEDRLRPKIWDEPERISPAQLTEWLERTVNHEADFLTRGRVDRISEQDARFDALSSSLALVKPATLTVSMGTSARGSRQVRAQFELDGVRIDGGQGPQFDLVVTDDVFDRSIWTNVGDRATVYSGTANPVYLTVSLSEPYKGYHYKLVAAVITGEEIAQARGRAGVLPF